MASRNRVGHRAALVTAGLAGLYICFRTIVAGPAPVRAAPDQPVQAVIPNPFDQPPFSNFGQGQPSSGGGFRSRSDLRSTVS